MSRFLKALFVSAAATTVAFIVAEVVRSSPRAAATKDGRPDSAGATKDPQDDLSDELKSALVSELGEHV